jgi:hypothetical protein
MDPKSDASSKLSYGRAIASICEKARLDPELNGKRAEKIMYVTPIYVWFFCNAHRAVLKCAYWIGNVSALR